MAVINIMLITNNKLLVKDIKNRTREYDEITEIKSYSEISKKIKERLYDLVLYDEDFAENNLASKINEIAKFQSRIGYFAVVGSKVKAINRNEIPADCFLNYPIDDDEFKALIVKIASDKENKRGFYNYMTRPIVKEDFEKVISAVYQFITTPITFEDFEKQNNSKKDIVIGKYDLLGKSEYTKKTKSLIEKVAKTDMTVLIVGESGSGKEIVAKNIYYKSMRNDKPFVVVNCAAISPTLIEAELFGYEKGAFTGANVTKSGIIEEANGGTLFLDEIGDMELNSQAKLLRVLENGEMRKVGGSRTIKVNVRFIAATNKNLKKEVEEGRFRKDLYFRLFNYPIIVKPLRERREDIPDFIEFIVNDVKDKFGRRSIKFSDRTYKDLLEYKYPGNIRELRNIIERMVVMSEGESINEELYENSIEHIESSEIGNDELSELIKNNILELGKIERAVVAKALRITEGNKQEAAKILGIGRTTLYDKLEKYDLK